VGVKRTMTLEIGGAKFKIVSDADQSHLVELAGIVNERMQKLTDAGARSASSAQLLALVSLGLADELKTAKHKLSEADRISRSAITNAIARIDEELAADAARQAPADGE
jgi:cell division protein ZapA (FtsZ GTPase activity inhibitor)